MAPKRRIETVDLTDDESSSYLNPKQHRTTYHQPPGASQANAVILDDDDDGDDASQEAPELTQGYNEQQYSYALYGTLSNKIVGVRFYDGYATTGEMVVCRREPHNPYDANAIQVLNVQNRQIGHLPRTLASRLAKYMDNRSLLIEAILTGPKAGEPNARRQTARRALYRPPT